MLTRLLKFRLFPSGLQWISALFFALVVGVLLFGPPDKDNPANLVVWLIWWPSLCLLFLVAGRIWCGLCPFALMSDCAQRVTGVRLALPDFLKRYGGWIILVAFLLLSWLEETTGIVASPRKTAVMLLTILTGAVVFGLFFKGRAWCRNVCPLGGISLVYARTSLFKLRNNESACAECSTKDCVAPDAKFAGCPMHLTPFAMDTVANCNTCGACVKRCPNGSLRLTFEAPSRDLSGQSTAAPVVIWLIVLLAGLISFLNCLESSRLPVEGWLDSASHPAHPVLLKTALLTGALIASWGLFEVFGRMAGRSSTSLSRSQLLLMGALSMIPLLLFSHLGHVGSELWGDGGALLEPLAEFTGMPWLRLEGVWGAPWTKYFSPLCIAFGLVLALGVMRWSLAQASGSPVRRVGLYFTLFYFAFAGWNLFATWPTAPAAATPMAALSGGAPTAPVIEEAHDGWKVVWPFVGINVAFLILALIARRAELQSGAATDSADFSANHSWVINDASAGRQTEILDWLLEQAVQARWRVPAVAGLANAGSEIITFLQRTLPAGSPITVNAILRKNKGVLTISHEGRPLNLPEYKPVSNLEEASDAAMEGLELRLASAQVESMSYQARLSELRCSFTLRQPC